MLFWIVWSLGDNYSLKINTYIYLPCNINNSQVQERFMWRFGSYWVSGVVLVFIPLHFAPCEYRYPYIPYINLMIFINGVIETWEMESTNTNP